MSPSSTGPMYSSISLEKTQGCPERRRRSWFFLSRAPLTELRPAASGERAVGGRAGMAPLAHQGPPPHPVEETRGQELRARVAADRHELHDVEADDAVAPRHGRYEIGDLEPGETAGLGRAHARALRGVDHVEVDRDVDVVGERVDHGRVGAAHLAHATRREHGE